MPAGKKMDAKRQFASVKLKFGAAWIKNQFYTFILVHALS